jgi:Co/Zn/Cd efflux system component
MATTQLLSADHLASAQLLSYDQLASDASAQTAAGLDASRGESARAKAGRQAAATAANKKLIAAMCFCFLFMIAEVVGGYYAHSLAIMTE